MDPTLDAPRPCPFIDPDRHNPDAVPIETLGNQIAALSAHINAAQYRLLSLISEFERRGGWGEWGTKSCAHWLNWRCGIALGAAREKVRVARALPGLPLVSAAFEKGELSFSKVRALTRIATPENEDYLMMIARHGTAAHVEALVRKYRQVERHAERSRAGRQQARREVYWYYDDDDGSLVLKVKLPPEQGAVVLQAVEAAVKALEPSPQDVSAETSLRTGGNLSTEDVSAETLSPEPKVREPFAAKRADALVVLAESFLSNGLSPGGSAERYTVTVHVDQAVLQAGGGSGRCELENGPWLAADTARRLACDAGLVPIIEDEAGEPLSVGRKTRAIPPALKRALQSRDQGCRFPGCTEHRFVDGHHIEHWAAGGETKLDNLVLLCRRHHRLVHEGGYGLDTGETGLCFTHPDGRTIAQVPHPSPVTTDIEQLNRQHGLAIDADTGECLWEGEKMDYGVAIEELLRVRRNPAAPVEH